MAIYILMLIGILTQTAFGGSRIAVSLYALEMGAEQATVGMVVAMYSICPLLLSILIGKYADRVHARVPMTVATVGIGLALLLPPLVQGLAAVFLLALALGLFHQVFLIPFEASVGGVGGSQKRARNYSIITMGHAAGNVFGPLAAGYAIDQVGHVSAFYVLAAFTVPAAALLVLMPRLLPGAEKHAGKEGGGSVFDLWRIRHLRSVFIAGGIIGTAQDLLQFYMPIYGHSIGLTASAIGTIVGMSSVAIFVIRAIVPLIARHLTEAQVITRSMFLSAGAFALLPFFENPYALGAITFALGLGCGGSQPMAMSLIYVLTPQGRLAEATGVRKTVINLTHLLVPMLFGAVGGAFGVMAVFLSNSAILSAGGTLMSRTPLPSARQR